MRGSAAVLALLLMITVAIVLYSGSPRTGRSRGPASWSGTWRCWGRRREGSAAQKVRLDLATGLVVALSPKTNPLVPSAEGPLTQARTEALTLDGIRQQRADLQGAEHEADAGEGSDATQGDRELCFPLFVAAQPFLPLGGACPLGRWSTSFRGPHRDLPRGARRLPQPDDGRGHAGDQRSHGDGWHVAVDHADRLWSGACIKGVNHCSQNMK